MGGFISRWFFENANTESAHYQLLADGCVSFVIGNIGTIGV
jgi:hypothetical protein